jgi:signal transduction histidine kinase
MTNILVVNGPPEERRAIVEALSRLEGVAVQCSMPDLETATSVLAQYTPDILVTGTELADGEGIRLVEKVRRRGMSIVVVGAAPSRDVWLRYLAAGADRFVEQDGELKELQDVVRGLVRQVGAARVEATACLTGGTASGIVHEFNNYLHALEVLLEMLERSPGETELWTEARAALEQAVCLMAMLLGHARDERSRSSLLDFGAVVRSAVVAARHLVRARCDVALEVAGSLPRIRGVASELERMVLDLVLNASEAMETGGELRVVVTRTPDTVLLAITSAGAALRGGREERGLEMARAIVERHGGLLLVATCEPASSSVLVTLPVSTQLAC